MLSALGINGATINMMDKWGAQWSKTLGQLHPDMVILAYGTNEAFNDTFDLVAYRQLLVEKIRQIRQQAPNSAILLIGPSDSIKNKDASDCRSQQPQWLTDIIRIQRKSLNKSVHYSGIGAIIWEESAQLKHGLFMILQGRTVSTFLVKGMKVVQILFIANYQR